MADYSVLSNAQEFEVQFRRFAANMRVCLPGVIDEFDAGRQRARVVPGVRMKTIIGRDVSYIDLPVIENVPIVIPSAGGFAVTLPIRPGDPCLLVFADRDIDNFLVTGKAENPGSAAATAPRAHHLTDAICIPGIVAEPQVLSGYASDALEMRDKSGNNKIRITSSGIEIKASGMLKIDASNITLDSSMTLSGGTFTDGNDRNSTAHTHTYTEPLHPSGDGSTSGANA